MVKLIKVQKRYKESELDTMQRPKVLVEILYNPEIEDQWPIL